MKVFIDPGLAESLHLFLTNPTLHAELHQQDLEAQRRVDEEMKNLFRMRKPRKENLTIQKEIEQVELEAATASLLQDPFSRMA